MSLPCAHGLQDLLFEGIAGLRAIPAANTTAKRQDPGGIKARTSADFISAAAGIGADVVRSTAAP